MNTELTPLQRAANELFKHMRECGCTARLARRKAVESERFSRESGEFLLFVPSKVRGISNFQDEACNVSEDDSLRIVPTEISGTDRLAIFHGENVLGWVDPKHEKWIAPLLKREGFHLAEAINVTGGEDGKFIGVNFALCPIEVLQRLV